MYQLEDRILFDAALITDINAAQNNEQNSAPQDSAQQAQDQQSTTESNVQELSPILPEDNVQSQETVPTADSTSPTPTNVLVVSENLENLDALLGSIDSDTILVRYNPETCTGSALLEQINSALDGKKADSIGFLTNAAKDGKVDIVSDSETSLDTLDSDAQKNFWEGIKNDLTENGKIDIFASNLASTEEGKQLVNAISELTDSKVEASSDVTGDAAAGGDWELEYVANGEHSMDVIDEYFDVASLDTFDHRLEDPTEVVFINSSVKDADSIVAGLSKNAEIVYIDEADGFDQVTEYLRNRTDVDTVRIFTHGDRGEFSLGSDKVDQAFLTEHQADLAVWGNAMAKDGDIMLYGCNVAANDAGQDFIQTLADLTGADIAASTDRTGKTGDWDLEFTIGQIETAGFVIADYQYILREAGTLTVKNMADYLIVGNEAKIDESKLTLREAIAISVDGDSIVFADLTTLTTRNINLVDTLTISTAISIDGTIATTTTPTSAVISVIPDVRAFYIDTDGAEKITNVLENTGEPVEHTLQEGEPVPKVGDTTTVTDAPVVSPDGRTTTIVSHVTTVLSVTTTTNTTVGSSGGNVIGGGTTATTTTTTYVTRTDDYKETIVKGDVYLENFSVTAGKASATWEVVSTEFQPATTNDFPSEGVVNNNFTYHDDGTTVTRTYNSITTAYNKPGNVMESTTYTVTTILITETWVPNASDPTTGTWLNPVITPVGAPVTQNLPKPTTSTPVIAYPDANTKTITYTTRTVDLTSESKTYTDQQIVITETRVTAPADHSAPAAGNGGAFFIAANSKVNMTGLIVYSNTAEDDGGGIYNAGNLTYTATGDVTEMYNNTAGGSGGSIYNAGILSIVGASESAPFDINDSTATNGSGGGIYSTTGDITLYCVSFDGNEANGGSGGGLYINANNAQTNPVDFYHVDFISNIALVDGGGMYYINGNKSMTLEWSDFNGNSAGRDGGGLYLANNTGSVSIITSVVDSSGSSIEQGTNTQSSMSGNTADRNGGAVYIDNNDGSINFDFIKMVGNAAENYGGGMFIRNSGNVTMADMEIYDNGLVGATDTKRGAGIYYSNENSSSYSLTINRSNISANEATEFGGGIYLDKGSLKLYDSTLAYNGTAATLGGAIYMNAGTLNIQRSTMAYNLGTGAHIYMKGISGVSSSLAVANSIIFNLQSEYTGGDFTSQIYLETPGLVTTSVSTANNIYSHYYVDRLIGVNAGHYVTLPSNVDTFKLFGYDSRGDLAASLAASQTKSLAIQNNLFLDTELNYHANYRTRALSIGYEKSWALKANSGVAASNLAMSGYDQRGNVRAGVIGAFEPIFHVVVNSKSDDSSLQFTNDENTHFYDVAKGGSGLTLREAIYWIDSRDALLNLAAQFPALAAELNAQYAQRYVEFDKTVFASGQTNTVSLKYDQIEVRGNWLDADLAVRDIAINYVVRDANFNVTQADHTFRTQDDTSRITVDATESVNNGYYHSRHFYVGENSNIVINNLTLTNGKVTPITAGASTAGGSIYNDGDLTLFNVVVTNSTSTSKGYGGGIYNSAYGTAYLYCTTVQNNTAEFNANSTPAASAGTGTGGFGGGIYNAGTITIEHSTITGNIVKWGATALVGSQSRLNGAGIYSTSGLVYNEATHVYDEVPGYLYIANSTISENKIDASAASLVYLKKADPAVPGSVDTIISAGGYGSAIYIDGTALASSVFVSINNTIVNNTAIVKCADDTPLTLMTPRDESAAVYASNDAVITIVNTMIAENTSNLFFNAQKQYLAARDVFLDITTEAGVTTGTTITAESNNIIGAYNYYGDATDGTGYDWANSGNDNITGARPTISVTRTYAYLDYLRDAQGEYIMEGDPEDHPKNADGTYKYEELKIPLLKDNAPDGTEITGSTGPGDFGGFDNFDDLLDSGWVLKDASGNIMYSPLKDKTGTVISGQYAVFYEGSTYTGVDTSSDQYGNIANLNLSSALAYNGALTLNYRLLQDSVAINSGTTDLAAYAANFLTLAYDQRGASRDLGTTATTNVGSYENISSITVGSGKDSLTYRSSGSITPVKNSSGVILYYTYTPLWQATDLTLREALSVADDGTTIAFAEKVWKTTDGLNTTTGNLKLNLAGTLSITRDVTIDGTVVTENASGGVVSTGIVEITGNNKFSLFKIKSAESNNLIDVTLQDMTLTKGNSSTTGDSTLNGGAIYSAANLTLENVNLTSNTAVNGGAVYSTEGLLTLDNVTASSNLATKGGAIYAGTYGGRNALVITDSSLLDNRSTGTGGAVYLLSGNATINYSTLGRNAAGGSGGAIYVDNSGTLSMLNSTISNNSTAMNGGAIAYYSDNTMTLNFVTIANNNSGWYNGVATTGTTKYGGAIFMNNGTFNLTNSIVAQNFRGKSTVTTDSTTGVSTVTGTHDDIYINSGAFTATNSLVGTYASDSLTAPVVGATNKVIATTDDWTAFAGTLDTKLTRNGGVTNTVHVFSDEKALTWLQYANGTQQVTDQTQLMTYTAGVASTVSTRGGTVAHTGRYYVGAYEMGLRTLTHTGGNVTANGTWVNENGTTLTMDSTTAILTASNTRFLFTGGTSSTVSASLTLRPDFLKEENLSYMQVSGTAVLTVADKVALNAGVYVNETGILNLTTTNYANLRLRLDGGHTTVMYSATGAQSLMNLDYNGVLLEYDRLVLEGNGTKESVKTFIGDLTVKESLDLNNLVTFKVTSGSFGGYDCNGDFTFNGTAMSGASSTGSKITATGNVMIKGAADINHIAVSSTTSGKRVFLQNAGIELSGDAVIGGGNTAVQLDRSITVTGAGNFIKSNGRPIFNDQFGTPIIAIGTNAGAEVTGDLTVDVGSIGMIITTDDIESFTSTANSRLAFKTTGTLDSWILPDDDISNIEGTVGFYGIITVKGGNFDGFNDSPGLEFGGTVTVVDDMIIDGSLKFVGKVNVSSPTSGTLTIASVNGSVTMGGNPGDVINIPSGNLVIAAKTDVTLGGVTSRTITVYAGATIDPDDPTNITASTGPGNIYIGGNLKATAGDITLIYGNNAANKVTINEATNTSGTVIPVNLTATGKITTGVISNATNSELQFSAGTAAFSQFSDILGGGSVNFLAGKYQITGDIVAKNFTSKVLVNIGDDLTVSGNFVNTGTLTADVFSLTAGSTFKHTAGSITVTTLNATADGGNGGVTLTSSAALTATNINLTNNVYPPVLVGAPIVKFTNTGSLTVTGTLTVADDSQFINSAVLSNIANITLTDAGSYEQKYGTLTMTGTFASSSESQVVNSGTITANAFAFTGDASFWNKGIIKNAAGGTAFTLVDGDFINDNTVTIASMTFTGDGALTNNKGTLTAVTGITLAGGDLMNKATLKTSAITLDGGLFTNRGVVGAAVISPLTNPTIILDGNAKLQNFGTLTAGDITLYDDMGTTAAGSGTGYIANIVGTLSAANITVGEGPLLEVQIYNGAYLYVVNAGTSIYNKATIKATGDITSNGGDIDNYGTVDSNPDVIVNNDAILYNRQGGVMKVTTIDLNGAAGGLENLGYIVASTLAGDAINSAGYIYNGSVSADGRTRVTGTISAAKGDIVATGAFKNYTGTVTAQTLTAASVTNYGTLTMQTLAGTAVNVTTGNLDNGAVYTNNGVTVKLTGTITATKGAVFAEADINNILGSISALSFEADDDIYNYGTMTASITGAGAVSVDAAGDLVNGRIYTEPSGALTNYFGTINAAGGSMAVTGNVTNTLGGITVQRIAANALANNGTITLKTTDATSPAIELAGGNLVNGEIVVAATGKITKYTGVISAAGSDIHVTGNVTNILGSITTRGIAATGDIENYGTLTLSAKVTGADEALMAGGDLINGRTNTESGKTVTYTGTITAKAGDMTVNGDFTNAIGSITTMFLDSGTDETHALTNSGTLTVTYMVVDGDMINLGTLTASSKSGTDLAIQVTGGDLTNGRIKSALLTQKYGTINALYGSITVTETTEGGSLFNTYGTLSTINVNATEDILNGDVNSNFAGTMKVSRLTAGDAITSIGTVTASYKAPGGAVGDDLLAIKAGGRLTNGSGTYASTLNVTYASIEAGSLFNNGKLTMSTASGDITVTGAGELSNGFNSTLTARNLTMGTGELTNKATMTLSSIVTSGNVKNNLTLNGNTEITINDGADLTNNNAGVMSVKFIHMGTDGVGNYGDILNTGTITATAVSPTTAISLNGGTLDNRGTINTTSTAAIFVINGGDLKNTGKITTKAIVLENASTLENTGNNAQLKANTVTVGTGLFSNAAQMWFDSLTTGGGNVTNTGKMNNYALARSTITMTGGIFAQTVTPLIPSGYDLSASYLKNANLILNGGAIYEDQNGDPVPADYNTLNRIIISYADPEVNYSEETGVIMVDGSVFEAPAQVAYASPSNAQEAISAEEAEKLNAFASLAERGSAQERNSLFMSNVDKMLEELLAV